MVVVGGGVGTWVVVVLGGVGWFWVVLGGVGWWWWVVGVVEVGGVLSGGVRWWRVSWLVGLLAAPVPIANLHPRPPPEPTRGVTHTDCVRFYFIRPQVASLHQ